LKLIERLVNIVYPPKCIFCGELMDISSMVHICGNCFGKLPFTADTFTAVPEGNGKGYCDGAVSVFRYTGAVKEALKRFKFHAKPSYYKTFARLAAAKLARLTDIRKYDIVIGIPLHRSREHERGYNQARLVSKAISRELGLPDGSGIVKRIKDTKAQSLLDKRNRALNVRDAFSVKAPEKIKGKSVLLVDDIMTTGSTLEECGRILKQAGADRVMALVVATGRNC